jgi:hypothetical protein
MDKDKRNNYTGTGREGVKTFALDLARNPVLMMMLENMYPTMSMEPGRLSMWN